MYVIFYLIIEHTLAFNI